MQSTFSICIKRIQKDKLSESKNAPLPWSPISREEHLMVSQCSVPVSVDGVEWLE